MDRKEVSASSRSAITVVSGFASGKGVTIGTDLSCTVNIRVVPTNGVDDRIEIASTANDPHHLIETCIRKSMQKLNVKFPKNKSLLVRVDSKIPPAIGLKSSSSVSVATVKAIFDLFEANTKNSIDIQEVLRTSCEASIDSGASLTGAFDDAAAGYLGGLVFSDNLRFRLLSHRSLDNKWGSTVKVLVPAHMKLTSSLKLSDYHAYREQSLEAIEFARSGVIVQAMFLNSIIHSLIHRYSLQPIVSSIEEGASASGISGKGPAIAALCPTSKAAERIERRWIQDNPDCQVISTTVTKAIAS